MIKKKDSPLISCQHVITRKVDKELERIAKSLVISELRESGDQHLVVKPTEVSIIRILPNEFLPKTTSVTVLDQMRRSLLWLIGSLQGEHTIDLVHVAAEGKVDHVKVFGDSKRVRLNFVEDGVRIVNLGDKDVGEHVVAVNTMVGFAAGFKSGLSSVIEFAQGLNEEFDSRGKFFVVEDRGHRNSRTDLGASDRNGHQMSPSDIAPLLPKTRARSNRSKTHTDGSSSTKTLRGEVGEDL